MDEERLYFQKQLAVGRSRLNVKEKNKHSLKKRCAGKIRTAFIGAISQFEAFFGDLWGNGLPDDELTLSQAEFRKRWVVARTNILNNGNKQIRDLEKEFEDTVSGIEGKTHRVNVKNIGDE